MFAEDVALATYKTMQNIYVILMLKNRLFCYKNKK